MFLFFSKQFVSIFVFCVTRLRSCWVRREWQRTRSSWRWRTRSRLIVKLCWKPRPSINRYRWEMISLFCDMILYCCLFSQDIHQRYVFENCMSQTWRCGCLVTWFCCQLIAKPGNKTAAPSWPDPYLYPSWANELSCCTFKYYSYADCCAASSAGPGTSDQ